MDIEINAGHSRTTTPNRAYEPFPFSPMPASANRKDKEGAVHPFRLITLPSVMASLSLSWTPIEGPVGRVWYKMSFVHKIAVDERVEGVALRFWHSLAKFSTTYAELINKGEVLDGFPFFAREVYVAEGHAGPWGQLCWKMDRSEAVKALLIHAYGARNLFPCDGCFERWAKMSFEAGQSGCQVAASVPFWECVSHRTEWEGACSNCVYHEKGSSCSHRLDHDQETTGWIGYIKKGNKKKGIPDSAPREEGGGVDTMLRSEHKYPRGETITLARGLLIDQFAKLALEHEFESWRHSQAVSHEILSKDPYKWVSLSTAEVRLRREDEKKKKEAAVRRA